MVNVLFLKKLEISMNHKEILIHILMSFYVILNKKSFQTANVGKHED